MINLLKNLSHQFKSTESHLEEHLKFFDTVIHFLEYSSKNIKHFIANQENLLNDKDSYTYNYNYIPPLAILNLDIDNSMSIKTNPIQFFKNNPVISSLVCEDLQNEFSTQGGTLKWITLVVSKQLAVFFNDLLIKYHHAVDKDLIIEISQGIKQLEEIGFFNSDNLKSHRIQAIRSFDRIHKFVSDVTIKIENEINSSEKHIEVKNRLNQVKQIASNLSLEINNLKLFDHNNGQNKCKHELVSHKYQYTISFYKNVLILFKAIRVISHIVNHIYQDNNSNQATKLDDYKRLFLYLDSPSISTDNNFGSQTLKDNVFAFLQLAGANPVVIERVFETSDARIFITNEQFKQAIGNQEDSLETAIEQGRVYLSDYSVLDGFVSGSYPQPQKYLYAPLVLFALPSDSDSTSSLIPVAIKYNQDSKTKISLRNSNGEETEDWVNAKIIVQMADANYHELISHLGRTHLFIEPFAVATYRKFSKNHPVRVLLCEHFKGTFLINYLAHELLVKPTGSVDMLLSGTINTDHLLTVKGAQSYLRDFNNSLLPKTIERRGVGKEFLHNYPYRDDALQIWDAIHEWVTNYLKIAYGQCSEIAKDEELASWVADLTSHDGGRIENFGKDGKITTQSELATALTMIIFTASAQHAAVNFPQKDLMGYAPAYPLGCYSPGYKNDGTPHNAFDLLPSLKQAQDQIDVLYLLGSVYFTKLGEYSNRLFKSSPEKELEIKNALQVFKNRLAKIEASIVERNKDKNQCYQFLQPSKIPQSINI